MLTAATLSLCTVASANTITATGSNGPNWNVSCPGGNPATCVVGDPSVFAIKSATLTTNDTGGVSANIFTNFGDATLTSFNDVGLTLFPADMIITASGGAEYAIVLDGHGGLVTGGLYSITGTETAQTVLGNPGGVTYRNTLAVWANPSGAVLLGTGIVGITGFGNGATNPEYDVSVTGITGGAALYNAGTISFELASATCGNGVVFGSSVPEPATWTLMLAGAALIVAAKTGKRLRRT